MSVIYLTLSFRWTVKNSIGASAANGELGPVSWQ